MNQEQGKEREHEHEKEQKQEHESELLQKTISILFLLLRDVMISLITSFELFSHLYCIRTTHLCWRHICAQRCGDDESCI